MPRDRGKVPETLHELLDQESIELGEMPRPGGKDHGGFRSKLFCPACGGGRTKEKNFYVSIDPDGLGFQFICHRASCGITGGRRLPGAGPVGSRPIRTYRRPRPPETIDRPDTLVSHYASFGISRQTIESLGIHRVERPMPVLDPDGKQTDEWRRRPCIAYPYRADGALLNVKYKTIYPGGQKRFIQEPDPEPSLFNIDSVPSRPERIVIVEGEDDVAAMVEAGFRATVTLANGSPSKLSASYDRLNDTDERYIAVRPGWEPKLDDAAQVYLAGDMDEAGARHHEELARRIGKARCWLVRWPGDCKDAKDTLARRGRDAVRFAIEAAMPYPLEGVVRVTEDTIRDLYNGVRSVRYETGYLELDQRVSLSDEGLLVVTTGIPGHGKSAFWHAMAVLYAERTEDLMKADVSRRPFHTIICSQETKPERVIADMVSQRIGKPFFPHRDVPRAGFEEVLEAKAWVEKHVTFLGWPDRSSQPPMSWVRERARELVLRTGAKLLLLDPWQEFDDERPERDQDTHSRWIGKVLQGWVGFASDYHVNVGIVVHPAKMRRDRDGRYAIPIGYDIGDSQNFSSRCFIGLTIHRANPKETDMLVKTWKSKDRRFATIEETVVRFDPLTTRIWPKPVDLDSYQPAEPHWQERQEG
jgi:twinkle protein